MPKLDELCAGLQRADEQTVKAITSTTPETDALMSKLYDEIRACYGRDKMPMQHPFEQLEIHARSLEEALQSIANNTCCDKCQEAALVARAALQGDRP